MKLGAIWIFLGTLLWLGIRFGWRMGYEKFNWTWDEFGLYAVITLFWPFWLLALSS